MSQTDPQTSAILERLDRLERENQALTQQVRDLQAQLAALRGAPAATAAPAAPPSAPAAPSVHEQSAAVRGTPGATAAPGTPPSAPAAPSAQEQLAALRRTPGATAATAAPPSAPAAPTVQAQLAALRGTQGATAAPATPTSAPAAPSVQEQLAVQQQRIEEQAQTKVEASQKFPISLSGMLLFNSFMNSRQNGGSQYPTLAAATGPARDGATVRQTVVGLEFHGPRTLWGGAVHGSVYMDFFSGTAPLGQTLRLRTGDIEIDWKSRSILVGVEKPIFNPREPASLAQVGLSPLSGTGNLWLWVPQVRLEQDFSFGRRSGLRARVGAIETQEVAPYENSTAALNLERFRPGLEGRFELYHNFDDDRRIELAPGFHQSTTHANGFSIPSQVVSVDWFMNPWRRLEFSGAFFSGQNVSNLGTGALNQGYAVLRRVAWAIGSEGGWGQLALHTWPRIDLHFFFGDQQYGTNYLGTGDVSRNVQYGVNLYYRLAPNVILAPEISQLRSRYIGQTVLINNHYDLALAYLF